MSSFFQTLFFLILSSLPHLVFASDSVADAQEQRAYFDSEFDKIKKDYGQSLIHRFEEVKGRSPSLKRKDRIKKNHYFKTKENLEFWNYVFSLRKSLMDQYQKVYPSKKISEEIKKEANTIAFKLITGIHQLKDKYNIHSTPKIHNLFINLKLAKRGFCRHWAEDLLNILENTEIKYFDIYWAEAKAGTIAEHNTASLTPRGALFEDGLIIDPWRKAGKPFWTPIRGDKWNWKKWSEYQP